MTTAQTTNAEAQNYSRGKIGPALEQEAAELDALHTGVVRHLAAWRDAHEAALLRLGAVMARMDSILARAEERLSAPE
ncbi:MAG: hypothetical protein K8S25_13570 [Alphaproteobacteria bacterium]|nr:hypothetical protein [Alphaproteobacteria bacterium]